MRQEFKFKHPNLSESAYATAYPLKGNYKLLGSYQASSEIREGPVWKEMYGTSEIVTGGKTVGMEQMVKNRTGGFDAVYCSSPGIKNSVWTWQQPWSSSSSGWAGVTGRDSQLGVWCFLPAVCIGRWEGAAKYTVSTHISYRVPVSIAMGGWVHSFVCMIRTLGG